MHVLDKLEESSDSCKAILEKDLIEYEDVDITPSDFACIEHESIEVKPVFEDAVSDSSSDSCADIDYNNNRGPEEQDKEREDKQTMVIGKDLKKPSGTDYSQSLQTILDDLDVCLDNSCGDSNELITADKDTAFVTKVMPETPQDDEKRLSTLNCWKHTMLTPPERVSFCKAIDSVLITKKRLIDSAEKSQNQTPLHHQPHQDHDSLEGAARALNYAAGDLGASGFMKFSTVTDENGSTVIVAKPVKSFESDTSDLPVTSSCKDQMVPKPGSSNTYFASLHKTGNLSPFIRSIAEKYKLFQPSTPNFKDRKSVV